MAKFRGWRFEADPDLGTTKFTRPVVFYNPRLDQVFVLNKTTAGSGNPRRLKELWRYDFGAEAWMYNAQTYYNHQFTNFQLDQNNDLVIVGGIYNTSDGEILKWDNLSQAQGIVWSTGLLNLEGPTTKKQIYKVVTVAKNGTNVTVSVDGLQPDGVAVSAILDDSALHTGENFGVVSHVLTKALNQMEDITFAEVQISGTAEEDFELHSVSLYYREKGAK